MWLNWLNYSVQDRCTKSHEYVFLLTKSPKYYFDNEAIKEDAKYAGDLGIARGSTTIGSPYEAQTKRYAEQKANSRNLLDGTRNKRSVWNIATMPYSEAHFATFPEKLIEPMVLAGCPKNGVILDPFMGAGTTGLVSKKLGRNYVGCELNPAYIKIAEERINGQTPPLF